jgi:hypothetical protein
LSDTKEKEGYAVWTCDKCGKEVEPTNDAVDLEFLRQYGERPDSMSKFNYGARHLLPVDGCVGSPSRAQYIKGQPRDRRSEYPYRPEHETEYREAYSKLVLSE